MDSSATLNILIGLFRGRPKALAFLAAHPELSIENPSQTDTLLALASKASAIKRTPRKRPLPPDVREMQTKLATQASDHILHTARTLALCSLPVDPTDERTVVREAIDANGTKVHVRYSAHDPKIKLPTGNDRAPLTWLMTMARERGTPLVEFNTAIEFMRDFGITGGGENYKEFRAAMERISNVVITYGWERSDTGEYDTGEKLVNEKFLPSRSDARIEETGLARLPGLNSPYFIRFGEQTFRELVSSPVSIPIEILRRYRNNPTCWDLLNCIVSQASEIEVGEKRTLSVPMIAQFIGGRDKNVRKLKMKLEQLSREVGDYLNFSVTGRGQKTELILRSLPPELRSSTPVPTLAAPAQGDLVAGEGIIMGELVHIETIQGDTPPILDDFSSSTISLPVERKRRVRTRAKPKP